MVVKKFIKRDSRLFGPYYYESKRVGNKVNKIYIGGEKEYREWKRKNSSLRASSEKSYYTSHKKGIFLISAIALAILLSFVFINFWANPRISGFVIDENGGVHYGAVENESIVQNFDSVQINLSVKEPVKLNGEVVSRNKNKRMDFETPEGAIRLYFDLLNYSEFIENAAEEVNATVELINLTGTNITKINLSEEINITANFSLNATTNLSVDLTENATGNLNENSTANLTENPVSNETGNFTGNFSAPEVNETNASINENELNNETGNNEANSNETNLPTDDTTSANETSIGNAEETIDEEIIPESVPETVSESAPETVSESASVSSITGNIARAFAYPFKFIAGLFKFTGRAVETNLSSSNETENQTAINQSEINETIPASPIVELNISEVKDKINELNNSKVDEIAENSVISAESFEVNISETPKESSKYKWGYKVKLKDLKFMAKIDVTTNQTTTQYGNYSLQIGNNLLSFQDLVDRGYNVRIEMPSLEMEVNATIAVASLTNETAVNASENIINETNESAVNPVINNTSEEANNTDQEASNITEVNSSQNNNTLDETINQTIVNEETQTTDSSSQSADDNINNSEMQNPGITGNIIKGFFGLAGRVIEETITPVSGNESQENSTNITVPDIEYNYTVSVYIERDFSKYNKNANADNFVNASLEGVDYEDMDKSEDVSIGDIIYLDPTLTTFYYYISEDFGSYNNITYESNFTHLQLIGDTSNPWRGFNYTSEGRYFPPYLQDDNNSYASFDGRSTISFPSSQQTIADGSNFTISAWIYEKTAIPVWSDIYGMGSGASMDSYGAYSLGSATIAGIIRAKVGNSSASVGATCPTVSLNTWTHLVAIFNGTSIICYNNNVAGTAVSTSTLSGTFPKKFINLYTCEAIGAAYCGPSFNGTIDNVLVLNRSLSSSEVSSLYALGRKDATYTDANLVSAWRFDNTNMSVAVDSMGRNNGTFNGSASYGYDALGLVAYYPMEDFLNFSNKTYDYSGNNYDGVLTGTTFNSSCVYGGCRSFNGVADKISMNISENINTTTLWIKNSTASSWSFVAYNGSSWFVNGVIGAPAQYPLNISGTSIKIGVNYTGNQYFNGLIDEVMLFNIPLNSSQIFGIYNNQSARFKSWGIQTLVSQNISPGNSIVGIKSNFSNNFDTNISGRIGAWDVSLGYNNSDLNSSANGLVSYWHFDEAGWSGTSGEVEDAMGRDDGTGYGGVNTTASGKFGRAGSFDGVDDYVDTHYTGVSNNNFTYSLWFNPVGPSSSVGDLISSFDWQASGNNGGSWIKTLHNPLRIYAAAANSSHWYINTGTTALPSYNTWYHAVLAYDYQNSKLNLYLNGILVQNATVNGYYTSQAHIMKIGRILYDAYYFNGSIDDVMIFNRSLSADEVKELYLKGRTLWNYSEWQNLSSNVSNIFNISQDTTSILPEFRLSAGNSSSNPFYSPVLFGTSANPIRVDVTSMNASVYSCGILNSSNMTYYLISDLMQNSNSDCLSIIAENITLDCAGHYIYTTAGINKSGIFSNTSNTRILNCRITMGNGAGGIGINLTSANNSYLSGNNFGDNNASIYLTASSNSVIEDSNFSSVNGKSIILAGNSGNNTCLNCSYNISNESIEAGSSLFRKWHYSAFANDSSGNIMPNVNVSIYNVSASLMFSSLTNSYGYSPDASLIEYSNNGGTRTYYSNYTINATHPELGNLSHSYNITLRQNLLNDSFQFTNTDPLNVSYCRTLSSPGVTYTLSSDIIANTNRNCIIIGATSITLDCKGYSIYTTAGINRAGILSDNQFGIIIKNCNITMGNGTGGIGINLTGALATSSFIINNSFGDSDIGIYINATGAVAANNSFNGNLGTGIYISSTGNNVYLNNITTGTGNGIYVFSSGNNVYNNNATSNSSNGIYILGNSNNFTSNNATSSSGNGIRINSSYNNLTSNNATSSSGNGTLIASPYNNLISNNFISSSGNGISINSNYNNLTYNNATSSSGNGIHVGGSYNNLTSNNATSSSGNGINISSSLNSLLSNIGASSSGSGISVSSNSSNFTSNNATSSSGNGLMVSNANYNIFNYTISMGGLRGVYVLNSANNNFYNDIANGTSGFYITASNNTNVMDCINVSGIYNVGSSADVFVFSTLGTRSFSFINCSYSTDYVLNTANSIFRRWWYRAYVNDTNGTALNDASVKAYNSSNSFIASALTSSGSTNKIALIDYSLSGTGVKNYYSNYTINASKAGRVSINHYLNVTNATNFVNDVFTLNISSSNVTASSLGAIYNKTNVNYNENANLSLSIPYSFLSGSTIDKVWAEITKPDSSNANVSMELQQNVNYTNLVSWWRMDDLNSSGGVVDYMGRNNGSNFSVTQTNAGRFGKAMSFDMDGSRISTGLSLPKENFTFSFWFKINENAMSRGKWQTFMSSTSGWALYQHQGNNLLYFYVSGARYINFLPEDNVWHHLACSINSSGNATAQVDGICYGDGIYRAFGQEGYISAGTSFTIGGYGWSGNTLNGSIDDVMIFNRTLTADEILALYNNATDKYYAAYNHSGNLGDYNVLFKANLTDGDFFFNDVARNFSVQNISIGINAPAIANTSESMNINGTVRRTNGTDFWNITNTPFIAKINGVMVSTNSSNGNSSFSLGSFNNTINSSGNKNITLNLSIIGNISYFTEDFGANPALNSSGYVIDSNNSAYGDNYLFNYFYKSGNIGNITYKFTSPTMFYGNATVLMQTGENFGTGNTSLWYSYNGNSWFLLNATNGAVSQLYLRNISVNGNTSFYVRIKSDMSSGDSPVSAFAVNYTSYQYASSGTFNSPSIYLPNVSYTYLRIVGVNNTGNINIQMRESDDNASWNAWSSFYNSSSNDISNFSKAYLQYKAILSSSNGNLTPVLQNVIIDYSNTTTNSTGGYNYNVTVPATDLGVKNLEVIVLRSDSGIIGGNASSITLWAKSRLVNWSILNYTGGTNYTVFVNFTRNDTSELVGGSLNITISNSSYSSSQACNGNNCGKSWRVSQDLGWGNYSVNITGSNETGYYRNSSIGYSVYLEESTTSGNIFANNATISDYSYSSEYSFLLNATINNTGGASMNNPYVFATLPYEARIKNITQKTSCGRIYPGQLCNATLNITIINGASSGESPQTLKLNWTNNDGTASSEQTYPVYINIVSHSSMTLSVYQKNLTIQHNSNSSFNFSIVHEGTEAISDIRINFTSTNITSPYAIPNSWVSVSPSSIANLELGGSRNISVNVSVPQYTSPGNYSGIINITSGNGGASLMNLSVSVPANGSWYFSPGNNLSCTSSSCTNYSFNKSFGFDVSGEIANYILFNTGNINLTFNVTYSPSGTSYSGLFNASGQPLFDANNPGSISVAKGSNSTLSINQTSSHVALSNVGVITNFYNESAYPANASAIDAFRVESQPPQISNILFSYDNFATTTSIAEVYRNMTIKVIAENNENLNLTSTVINITLPYAFGVVQLNASVINNEYELVNGKYLKANYTAYYTPQYNGQVYYARAIVYSATDTVRSNVSEIYNFTVAGTTSLGFSQNYSQINFSSIDLSHKGIFYVNYTINNSGSVYAYNPIINFSGGSYIEYGLVNLSNISSNSTANYIAQLNVSQLTPPGNYSINATLKWVNPISINNPSYTSSSPLQFNITVGTNKSFSYSPDSLVYDFSSGETVSNSLRINNTGNILLSSFILSCSNGSIGFCRNFTMSFGDNNFNIGTNSSKLLNVGLTHSSGLASGTYLGYINISSQNISGAVPISAIIPNSYTWNVSHVSINTTKGAGQSGNLQEITITNTGNNILTFNINSSNSSVIYSNSSQVTVPVSGNASFMLNYSSVSEGNYFVTVNVSAEGYANPLSRSISVNLTSTNMAVNILNPTSSVKETGVLASQLLSDIKANASYMGTPIIDNSTWSIQIGGSECTNANSSYDATGNFWQISCNAPSLLDGLSYDLTASMNNIQHGLASATETGAIVYRDITPPKIYPARNNINAGENISLQVNMTDNVNITSAIAYLTYPNSTIINVSLSLSNGYYVNNSFALNEAGEYSVNYSAVDLAGNQNSSIDWFEVYDNYPWNVRLKDYNSTAVPNVNISLYRPNSILLLSNATDSNGEAGFLVNKRFYDLHSVISPDNFLLSSVNFTNASQSNISLNFHEINGEDYAYIVPLYKVFRGIASNSTGLSLNNMSVTFNYSGLNYESAVKLAVLKCSLWNYSSRYCSGSWSEVSSSRNINDKTINGNSTNFDTYFVAEKKCGNGLCELAYNETTSSCSDDCKAATSVTVVSSGGGGGGGGSTGLTTGDLTKIEDIVKSFLDIGGIKLETNSIYKEMFAGETTTIRISLKNTLNEGKEILLEGIGDTKQFLFFESNKIIMKPKEQRDILIKIVAPKIIDPGNYEGNLVLSSGKDKGEIPVTVRIIAPEGKLLDVKIQPLISSVAPGKVLRLQTDLLNLGKSKKVDVQFDLQLMDVNTGEVLARTEEAFAVETTISTVKNITIPENIKTGKYMVKGTAYYSNPEQTNMQASSIAYINVDYPLLQRKIFLLPVWSYLIILLAIGAIAGAFGYLRWLDYKKKRFKVNVELSKLPQPGSNSGFVGKVAETGIRTFVDLNKLQMHTLIAGSTGSGKTVAAQGIIEEALLHNKSVIVFDPTAQWTGFLRKTDDKTMFSRYRYFNMKEKDAKGFNGSIKTISDPYELINIKKYLNRQGEITIFNVSHLTPKEIDIVVASTIEQIFKSEPEESRELKTLIVYDEVHRLLPKFGGTGQGFVQLERGAREFRKWGIGLFLISQVLSDFVGEIKANIGTEIQMGTRYEGDLERVNMKYGEDVLKSVVKEPIGTGMMTNAEFNNGRPYFVAFRPLLHSTKRLSNADLAKYEKYFEEVEDLDYQISRLEGYGADVLDLNLEIKLAKSKIKEGQFQMADMYLETLRPAIEEQWKNAGKKPEHIVHEKIAKEDVAKGIEKAKEEREKFLKANPPAELSAEEEIKKIKDSIEDKKRKGKNTSEIENKLGDLENRLKPFKGKKLNPKDAEGIKAELKALGAEANRI